jgi:hypothetical protein
MTIDLSDWALPVRVRYDAVFSVLHRERATCHLKRTVAVQVLCFTVTISRTTERADMLSGGGRC